MSEFGASLRIRFLGNRYVATALAVAAIAFFAFYQIPDAQTGKLKPAGLILWTLFGTINQLLAGLTLMVATLYLHQRGRNPYFTGVPMVFMLISTFIALTTNLKQFFDRSQHLLLAVGVILLLVAVGVVIEGVRAALRRERHTDDAIRFAEDV